VFWFGTDKGVSRFDGKNWKAFTTKEGLLDSHVYAVAAAPNGDIWVGTRRGVAIIGRK
jgi:ligand-binding sensor domain-containing protein